ncbi:biotin--[acetyl-CoA-carboxylase] ligase [Solirubrum puertoriconensis]|uniref:Biotin--acetyl-CoA-carboxylase ligase n=1 Tax=Solirubrum puertoriconensis TaxID=1751427 RepID=A0A9X0HIT0_SOLP1|nr:biotin--[acetyl-CoA-carboxylase] ligase [Solirubrum puertoriconensis]KUG06632.1 biotin--acetyl-CoA-carboxylase ligase [Solirubrum puertoriconensis]
MEQISPQTLFTGQQVIWLPECGSTNTEARELLGQNRATEGCTVITDRQTAGRGQRGNQWEAKPGENLTLSVIWRPTFLPATAQFQLNLAVALGVHDWATGLLGPDPALRLKWPNDLFYQDQKLGGILIENTLSGSQIQFSIVGIGLNINQTDFGVPTATSLGLLTGRAYTLAPLATRLLEHLERRYLQLRAGHHQLRTDYLGVLYRHDGDWYPFEAAGQPLQGRIADVNEAGQLVLELASGKTQQFGLQEIKHVLPNSVKL